MKVQIYGKNITITQGMQEKVENKLKFLDKYLIIDENLTANVVVKIHPNDVKVEITIPTKLAVLRAEVTHKDFYAAVDLAIDKLEDQIRRQKTRLERKHKDKLALSFLENESEKEEDVYVRTKSISVVEMDLEEAIMRMEMLGHDFFIYRDDETHEINVVYARHDGGYGCIEVE
ncbi:ribosome hibernation-promoting factor, HPF/YfiA family [Traorella massiliensis]|jgi:putative sigma-54 modulation protein|uniref:ribosome hibernation-promoting factor, HPF/YfiA family n=1 Tax=Traorella massiliensis TaxID=1903263 RepID=UPI0008F86424|nr:ribosome-associated translation inhibitor RaiA [Traorella massiliensis]